MECIHTAEELKSRHQPLYYAEIGVDFCYIAKQYSIIPFWVHLLFTWSSFTMYLLMLLPRLWGC